MKSYSEMEQAILFKAARDLRKVAAKILDDCVNEVELTGATAGWALDRAQKTAQRANEMEDRGHELSRASTRQENDLYESRHYYTESFEAFEKRAAFAASRKASA